jgi:hypothetical protein
MGGFKLRMFIGLARISLTRGAAKPGAFGGELGNPNSRRDSDMVVFIRLNE